MLETTEWLHKTISEETKLKMDKLTKDGRKLNVKLLRNNTRRYRCKQWVCLSPYTL